MSVFRVKPRGTYRGKFTEREVVNGDRHPIELGADDKASYGPV